MIQPEVIKDMRSIITRTIESFNHFDAEEIMMLSDHIIHSASIYQTRTILKFAITIYSIGKIIARGKVKRFPQQAWNEFVNNTRRELNHVLISLDNNDEKELNTHLNHLQKEVMKLDESFLRYASHVIDRAKLKKGTKLFEHGVSLKRVAELFNFNEWDLRLYAGQTRILERDNEKSNVKERLNKIKEFFK